MKLSLDAVPPVPDGVEGQPCPNGDTVYEHGLERWRFDADGSLAYFIRYGADGRTRSDEYAPPGRRR